MNQDNEKIAEDIVGYLEQQENKSLLRFITCGSVDDGKSTLIGRLLYDSKLLYEDQLAGVEQDSKKVGTQGQNIDFALLVDGLAAEREQGITIDVAYRFFSTSKRKFIVADTPGHEQYTRNMATGASTADAAVILIDARQGVLTQTRRHSFICSLLGIRHIIVAINKMDLVGFNEETFEQVKSDYQDFSTEFGFESVTFIPLSALHGDNVTETSSKMAWYTGPSLLSCLEELDLAPSTPSAAFRLPVQWVNRPNLDFRGFSGTIASGSVRPGDELITIPSGKRSKVSKIVTYDGNLDLAQTDQAVTITLEDEIDISRGDFLCNKDHPASQSDQFSVHLIWISEKEMLPGRQYLFKTNNTTTPGIITDLKYTVNVNNFAKEAAKVLHLNEVAVCTISLNKPVAFDPYKENRTTGSFIMIDRQTNETIGVGLIDHSLRRSDNIVWQSLDITKSSRAAAKNQRAAALWFTGLSGSGKSTIANLVEKRLSDLGRHTYILDGDNVRHGLNKDLGFTDADRVENIRRVAEVTRLMVDAGLITLVSFISPFRSERRMARGLLGEKEFIEIFINTPLEEAEKRDVKGLYKKARAGELKNFTGIDSDYQAPRNPEIEIDTMALSPVEAAEKVIEYLKDNGYLYL